MSALPTELLPGDWHVYRESWHGREVAVAAAVAHGVVRVLNPHEVAMVNAAIYLRRPLLVTGRPGTGKSSLVYLISRELGPVLRWSITRRTTLKEGLYLYDAIGRVQEINARCGEEPDIGEVVHLGPLGTALLRHERVDRRAGQGHTRKGPVALAKRLGIKACSTEAAVPAVLETLLSGIPDQKSRVGRCHPHRRGRSLHPFGEHGVAAPQGAMALSPTKRPTASPRLSAIFRFAVQQAAALIFSRRTVVNC